MHPGDEQQRELHPFEVRAIDPVGEHLGVVDVAPEQRRLESHADEVRHEQERNREPQHELRNLRQPVPELPAFVERPQTERPMDDRRRVEHDRHDRVSPERHVIVEPSHHRGVGNVAQGVIREMRQEIREEDEAASDADLPDSDTADESGRGETPDVAHRSHSDSTRLHDGSQVSGGTECRTTPRAAPIVANRQPCNHKGWSIWCPVVSVNCRSLPAARRFARVAQDLCTSA